MRMPKSKSVRKLLPVVCIEQKSADRMLKQNKICKKLYGNVQLFCFWPPFVGSSRDRQRMCGISAEGASLSARTERRENAIR